MTSSVHRAFELSFKPRYSQRQAPRLAGKTTAGLTTVHGFDMAEQVASLLVGRDQLDQLVALLCGLGCLIALATKDRREGREQQCGRASI